MGSGLFRAHARQVPVQPVPNGNILIRVRENGRQIEWEISEDPDAPTPRGMLSSQAVMLDRWIYKAMHDTYAYDRQTGRDGLLRLERASD